MPVILGIDEVGRGPWAGPLVVGAVILGENFSSGSNFDTTEATANLPKSTTRNSKTLDDLNLDDQRHYLYSHLADSKVLTAKQRAELAPLIAQHAAASATGWVSSAELDRYGLSASLKLATRRAVKQILVQKIPFDEIIIDGTVNFLTNTPLADRVTTLKKADALIKEVSAAAILAKVARDDYMTQLAAQYPTYGFEKHVGYGTKAHREAIEKYGICPEHRTSFRPIQEILGTYRQTLGRTAPKDSASSPHSDAYTAHSQSAVLLTHVQNASSTTSHGQSSTTARGQTAELAAARYLEQRGHRIIAHNFKTKTCEIDLISTVKDHIYFTEVKYSADPSPEGTPLVRITPEKQRKMAYAAQVFLKTHDFNSFSPVLAASSVVGREYRVVDWLEINS